MSAQEQSKREIKMPRGLPLVVDPEVAMVLEFMQSNIQTKKLIKVAAAVNNLAEPLWGHVITDPIPWDRLIPISFADD